LSALYHSLNIEWKKVPQLMSCRCFVTEFFHTYLDNPHAPMFSQDHVDCANLFFSAARMCIYFERNGFFDELGNRLPPQGFTEKFKTHGLKCSPPLEEADWRQQALWFLEQGRSRSLLESIVRGEEEILSKPKKLLLAHVVDVVRAQRQLERKISTPSRANTAPTLFDTSNTACQARYVTTLVHFSLPWLQRPLINS
jgi:hypothetical protein